MTGADNSDVVAHGLVRTSAVGLAVAALLALTWLPPEHVHDAHADDGHHAEVIHRHYEAHQAAADGTAADHGEDGPVHWLDAPFIGRPQFSHVTPALVAPLQPVPLESTRRPSAWVRVFVPRSVHDPPWRLSSGFRAPPFVPRPI